MSVFLKLGGSLITDKDRPETARLDVLKRLSDEIAAAFEDDPGLRLVLGHGSGSFGHTVAALHGTHAGAVTPDDWRGFAAVWASASRLTRIVIDCLLEAGLPAIALPPSSSAECEDGRLITMATFPIERTLRAGLLPVIRGDVAFDRVRGSTIVSTEKVMAYLAPIFKPSRVLMAGVEPGVFADFPKNERLVEVLTPAKHEEIRIDGARSTDVTGGMADKVTQAFVLARAVPDVEVRIFSGMEPGAVRRAISGGRVGTLILLS
jgi:isopentenyl phosphate kinase